MSYLFKLLISLYALRVRWIEKSIGYRIDFTHIPETWINGLVRFNMSPSWIENGIKAKGVNHWTIGSLDSDGVSSRYNRDAKQYQSWLGAYLVQFEEERPFTLQDHFNLAVADQTNWLEDLGDPHPLIEMPAENVSKTEQVEISGYPAKLYHFSGGDSHSDVGSWSNNSKSRYLMRASALLINNENPEIELSYKSLIPKNIFSEYENVILKGYVCVIELDQDTYVVLYGNGVVRGGRDYFEELQADVLKAFRAVRVKRLK